MPRPRKKTALVLTAIVVALAAAGVCARRTLVPRIENAMIGGVAKLGTLNVPTEVDSSASAVVQAPAELYDAPGAEAGAPAPRRRAAVPVGALDIPEDRVARLTEKQLRSLEPANVIGADGAASGVRLHGIGALGVGLADGDVVTSIDGRATPDVSTGMDAALRAWASGEAAAHATVLRSGRPLVVTVHIPRHMRVASGQGRSAHGREDD